MGKDGLETRTQTSDQTTYIDKALQIKKILTI